MPKSDGKYLVGPAFLALFLVFLSLCGSLSAEEVSYDSGKRRDPFVPLTGDDVSGSASSSGVKLEGIIYDPGNQSMAILSGKTYQVGEVVGDAKVVKILKDHVVISIDGEEKLLRIREDEKT